MSASQSRDKSLPVPTKRRKFSVWLDLLPSEVSSKIADLLLSNCPKGNTSVQSIPDALALAAVSSVQRSAMATTQTHISIEETNSVEKTNSLVQLWKALIPQVREIRLPRNTANNLGVIELLSRFTIEKAVIPNYPSLLNALFNGRSVRELDLLITTYCPENGEQGLSTSLLEVLRSCPVERIRIICESCPRCPTESCFVNRILQSMGHPKKRLQLQSKLQSLYVKCSSVDMKPLLKLASYFLNLVHFGLEHRLPQTHFSSERPVNLTLSEDVFNVLLHIRRLEMIDCGTIDSFVPDAQLPNLGQNLVSFCSTLALTAADVGKLGLCVNLERLSIVLNIGAEASFPQSIKKLQSISITWKKIREPILYEEYYSPSDSELATRISRRNPQIRDIRLKNVSLLSGTLEALLAGTSSELCILHVPIFHQPEAAPRRFYRLAKLVILHCRALQELEVFPVPLMDAFGVAQVHLHKVGLCSPSSCSLCSLHRHVSHTLSILHRRHVKFRDDSLRTLAADLAPDS